ncbi:MAG: hypothetical protein IH898_03040 [Planctomycetes bacterium]|nr:hypothetical protein [Planctomycetota bacterium]
MGGALLIFRELGLVIAALGAGFDAPLQADQSFQVGQIFGDAFALCFDLSIAVFLEQQVQQPLQLCLQLALSFDCRCQAVFPQGHDDFVKLPRNILLAALGNQFAEQLGATRLGRS